MKEANPSSAESIVVSLELARELREAGWPQDSVWYWHRVFMSRPMTDQGGELLEQGEYQLDTKSEPRFDDAWKGMYADVISAPSSEEILRKLPPGMMFGSVFSLNFAVTNRGHDHGIGWHVGYYSREKEMYHPEIKSQCSDSLANAAAAMYIHLKRNNLLR